MYRFLPFHYIALALCYIICHLEIISSILVNVWRFCTNTVTFYIRDESIPRFCTGGKLFLELISHGYQGTTVLEQRQIYIYFHIHFLGVFRSDL
jgi:hypothetical protein